MEMNENLRLGDDPSKGGVKKDEGKLRWSLLPWDAMEEVIKVLMFGADKYTFRYENKWNALFSVSNATKLTLKLGTSYVVTATKNSFDLETLNSKNDNSKTDDDGLGKIPIVLKSWIDVDKLILDYENATNSPQGKLIYDVSDLKMNLIGPTDVQSVEATNTCTLTMTIPQENSEASFVVNTTTASASWETMWQALKQHSIISKGADRHELSGNRNWEQGMDYGRLFDAGLRHQISWWQKGEGEAADSKIHHLAHAACDTLFLLAYELRKAGKDDRPSQPSGA
jgi:hypothetical protein